MGCNSPPTGINPGADLTVDVALDVLADPHRRAVLAELDRQAGPLPVETVAEAVAERMGAGGDSVAAALHHTHLPKLDAAGLVVYDHDARTVAAGPHLRTVDPLLALAGD